MRLHRNAALSWSGRRLVAVRVLEQGWTMSAAAAAAGVSVRCARKWVGRFRAAGEAGLVDRSSAPKRTPPERVAVIVALRQLRLTAAEIAETLAMPLSTVSVVLKRSGMGRLGLDGSRGRRLPWPQIFSFACAGVKLLDLVGEVLEADPALELQRRRHLALLDRELAREDRETLHLLDSAELLIDV